MMPKQTVEGKLPQWLETAADKLISCFIVIFYYILRFFSQDGSFTNLKHLIFTY
jgi:uncharacterized membrane protein YhdT